MKTIKDAIFPRDTMSYKASINDLYIEIHDADTGRTLAVLITPKDAEALAREILAKLGKK